MSLEDKANCGWFFPLIADRFFCDLTPESLKSFALIKHTLQFPKDAVIFAAGDIPRGVYFFRSGKAQILANYDQPIYRFAVPDEILGLTETAADLPFEISLKTITPCLVEFIEKEDFVRFLHDEPEVCFSLVKSLGSNLQKCCKLFISAIN